VEGPLAFARAAVGGTFDRLHAGHRSLLAASALVTTSSLYIGVTGGDITPTSGPTVNPRSATAKAERWGMSRQEKP
jgi:phosphopantetheine adenylyltransferase